MTSHRLCGPLTREETAAGSFLDETIRLTLRMIRRPDFDGISFIERAQSLLSLAPEQTGLSEEEKQLVLGKIALVIREKGYGTLVWEDLAAEAKAQAIVGVANWRLKVSEPERDNQKSLIISLITDEIRIDNKPEEILARAIDWLENNNKHIILVNTGETSLQPFYVSDLLQLTQSLLSRLQTLES